MDVIVLIATIASIASIAAFLWSVFIEVRSKKQKNTAPNSILVPKKEVQDFIYEQNIKAFKMSEQFKKEKRKLLPAVILFFESLLKKVRVQYVERLTTMTLKTTITTITITTIGISTSVVVSSYRQFFRPVAGTLGGNQVPSPSDSSSSIAFQGRKLIINSNYEKLDRGSLTWTELEPRKEEKSDPFAWAELEHRMPEMLHRRRTESKDNPASRNSLRFRRDKTMDKELIQ